MIDSPASPVLEGTAHAERPFRFMRVGCAVVNLWLRKSSERPRSIDIGLPGERQGKAFRLGAVGQGLLSLQIQKIWTFSTELSTLLRNVTCVYQPRCEGLHSLGIVGLAHALTWESLMHQIPFHCNI